MTGKEEEKEKEDGGPAQSKRQLRHLWEDAPDHDWYYDWSDQQDVENDVIKEEWSRFGERFDPLESEDAPYDFHRWLWEGIWLEIERMEMEVELRERTEAFKKKMGWVV